MTSALQRPKNGGRWLRFVVSGVINTGVDFATFAALVLWAGTGPFIANLVAFSLAVCCSFLLNRMWTFGDRKTGSPLAFFLWMAAIALLSSWLLDRVILWGVDIAPAKIGVTLLVVLLSYTVMNRIIFVPRRAGVAMIGGVGALAGMAGLNVLLPFAAAPLPPAIVELAPDTPRPLELQGPLKVYHLGHSLVGRDMPAMLAQLAGSGHDYGLQLGWGTSLSQHLAGPDAVFGFAEENTTPRFVPLDQALADQSYDAIVLTEMIGLRDAIRYHGSADAISRLVSRAKDANPEIAVFLYETWHPLDEGDWLGRIPQDWEEMWRPFLLAPAIHAAGEEVGIIPAGRVMARLVQEVEATPGGIGGMTSRADLFRDDIHLSDLGLYLVALTHFASLYDSSVIGLPHALDLADGSPAVAPSAELALAMQRIVDETVSSRPRYGL
jgi:putative flippase GtrA